MSCLLWSSPDVAFSDAFPYALIRVSSARLSSRLVVKRTLWTRDCSMRMLIGMVLCVVLTGCGPAVTSSSPNHVTIESYQMDFAKA